MDERRIVLVNLASGLLGELDSRLLGMIVIGKVYVAAMARSAARPDARVPFYLYIDEFQQFVTDTIAHMLASARKFNLCLTLANQTTSQLLANQGRENVLAAVLGNCGSLICFRLGLADAGYIEGYTAPELRARDLQELADYQAVVRLLVNNSPTAPFLLHTQAPRRQAGAARREDVVSGSRQRHARPVTEVEAEILARREWRKPQTAQEEATLDIEGALNVS